jgi:hypothetical protein
MELKKVQVDGEKYKLPAEEAEIQKLIKRGLSLDGRIRELSGELEGIKKRLTEIGENRRDGQTTVKLEAVGGAGCKITFRESLETGDGVELLKKDLGDLWGRFFDRKETFKATKELKRFLEGETSYGIDDPDPVKERIWEHVQRKTIKANVKLMPAP